MPGASPVETTPPGAAWHARRIQFVGQVPRCRLLWQTGFPSEGCLGTVLKSTETVVSQLRIRTNGTSMVKDALEKPGAWAWAWA